MGKCVHRKRWNFKYEFKARYTRNLNSTSDKFQNIHFKIARRRFKFECGERLNCKRKLKFKYRSSQIMRRNFAFKFRKIGCAISVCSIAARLSTKLQSRLKPYLRSACASGYCKPPKQKKPDRKRLWRIPTDRPPYFAL